MPEADLLQPSLQGEAPREPPTTKPWRVESQLYVGFFGGPLAVGVIAAINAGRLGLDATKRAAIAGAAIVAFGVLIVLAATVDASATRLGVRVAGLAVYGVAYFVQRKADRIYHYYGAGDQAYSELFAPGLVAVLAGIAIELVAFAAVSG